MSKRAVFLIAGICILSLMHAAQPKISASLKPEFGMMNGMLREYVIDYDNLNTGNVESRLDWQTLAVPYIGVSADMTLFDFLYLNFSGKIGLHSNSGIMQDYDYLNSVYDQWNGDDPTQITNYSSSKNVADSFYSVMFRAGWSFRTPVKIRLNPFASYEYEHIGFSAYGGTAKYKQNNFEEFSLGSSSQKVISYGQDINAVFLGLQAVANPHRKITLQADFLISPWLTWISCIDKHYLRSLAFLDLIDNVFQLKADLAFFYNFSQITSLGICAFIHYIPLSTGADYAAYMSGRGEITGDDWFYAGDTIRGGTDRFFWSVSLAYMIRF